MGGKYTGSWKYICLCIAGLIIFSGCARVDTVNKKWSARKNLHIGQKLLDKRDFKGSLRENMKALSIIEKEPPGDRALFNIGLIYAHYENPEKDYKKSILYFRRLVREYPRSPLLEQAKIWINVLGIIEKAKEIDIENEKKKKELAR